MELYTSHVPRALDVKTKLFGFELTDLVVMLLYLSISNLLFGTTVLKLPLVWGVSIGLAVFLYFFKKGKPDRYLQDFGEYLSKPDVFSAGEPDVEYCHFGPLQQAIQEEISE